MIAVLTIEGQAVFRIWDLAGSLADAQRHPELASVWDTEAGDVVPLVSGGWPLPNSRCPIHEAESPRSGDRLTLTLRHNKGGYGGDYFSDLRDRAGQRTHHPAVGDTLYLLEGAAYSPGGRDAA